MDETIRIYGAPTRQFLMKINKETVEQSKPLKSKPAKVSSRLETLKEVIREHDKKTHDLSEKYTLHVILYRWVAALTMVAVIIGLISWGLDIRTERKAEARTAAALEEFMAEIQAEKDAEAQADFAEKQSEEYIVNQIANELAKVFYGIRNFQDKYGYTEKDFMTLARCIFNRVENSAYSDDIFEVIKQESQWVGYYSNNPIAEPYKTMALNAVREWRAEESKPVTNDFVFAELTPAGIYLKNDFHADGYARRWQYS